METECLPLRHFFENYIAGVGLTWSNIFDNYSKRSFSSISFGLLFSINIFCIVSTHTHIFRKSELKIGRIPENQFFMVSVN